MSRNIPNGLEFIKDRRSKIIDSHYDRFLLNFDNDDEACLAEEGLTFTFRLTFIPKIHLEPLINQLKENNFNVYLFNEIEPFTTFEGETIEIRKPYYKVTLQPLQILEE